MRQISKADRLCGLDEVAIGPVIGPLVLVGTALQGDPEILADPWLALRPLVGRAGETAALTIDDSKAIYSGHRDSRGFERLERSALAAIAATGLPWRRLDRLIEMLDPEALERMRGIPWFTDLEISLPIRCDAGSIDDLASRLGRGLEQAHMTLEPACATILPARELNRRMDLPQTKAAVVWGAAARLGADLWARAENRRQRLVLDRQGGRRYYCEGLQKAFDPASIEIVTESRQRSSYLITSADKGLEVEALVKADTSCLPVALASIIAKYLREVLMLELNSFWRAHLPELMPTAGYPTDGRRFLSEITQLQQRLRIDRSILVRMR